MRVSFRMRSEATNGETWKHGFGVGGCAGMQECWQCTGQQGWRASRSGAPLKALAPSWKGRRRFHHASSPPSMGPPMSNLCQAVFFSDQQREHRLPALVPSLPSLPSLSLAVYQDDRLQAMVRGEYVPHC